MFLQDLMRYFFLYYPCLNTHFIYLFIKVNSYKCETGGDKGNLGEFDPFLDEDASLWTHSWGNLMIDLKLEVIEVVANEPSYTLKQH